MRVSMSAMGSDMTHIVPVSLLPAGFDKTGHVAAHRRFAQLVPAQAELAVVAVRTARRHRSGCAAAPGSNCRAATSAGPWRPSSALRRPASGSSNTALNAARLAAYLATSLVRLRFAGDHGFLGHICSLTAGTES